MNSNVISTEDLNKMADIFTKAGELKLLESYVSKPHLTEYPRDVFYRKEKDFLIMLEEFKEKNGTYYPLVDNKVKEIFKD